MTAVAQDPLAQLLNTQGQLQIARYGRPGVGGNLSGTLGYLADFIKGVYSMPEGSPGIFGGISEVLNRYNVRQYADQQFQAQQAQLARQLYEQQMQRQQLGSLTGIAPEVYLKSEDLNAARPYAENMATNESLNDYTNNGVYNARPMAKPETMGPIAKDFMTRQNLISDTNTTLKDIQNAYQLGSQGQNPYGTPTVSPPKSMPLQNMDPNIGPLQGGVNAQSAPSILGGVVNLAQLLDSGKQGLGQYNDNRTFGLDQSKLQEVMRSNRASEGNQAYSNQTGRMNAVNQAISDKVNAGLRAKELEVSSQGKTQEAEKQKLAKLATKAAQIDKQLTAMGFLDKTTGIYIKQDQLKKQTAGAGGLFGSPLGGVDARDAAKNSQAARLIIERNATMLEMQGLPAADAKAQALMEAEQMGFYKSTIIRNKK